MAILCVLLILLVLFDAMEDSLNRKPETKELGHRGGELFVLTVHFRDHLGSCSKRRRGLVRGDPFDAYGIYGIPILSFQSPVESFFRAEIKLPRGNSLAGQGGKTVYACLVFLDYKDICLWVRDPLCLHKCLHIWVRFKKERFKILLKPSKR